MDMKHAEKLYEEILETTSKINRNFVDNYSLVNDLSEKILSCDLYSLETNCRTLKQFFDEAKAFTLDIQTLSTQYRKQLKGLVSNMTVSDGQIVNHIRIAYYDMIEAFKNWWRLIKILDKMINVFTNHFHKIIDPASSEYDDMLLQNPNSFSFIARTVGELQSVKIFNEIERTIQSVFSDNTECVSDNTKRVLDNTKHRLIMFNHCSQ